MDELIPDNQMLPKENVELKQEIEAETIVKLERQCSNLNDELEEERLKFDIEEPENEYEEFLDDILELIEDEDNIDELKENYIDVIADQIQTIKEMKEEIENLNHQVKYLEDQQDQVTDKQRMNEIPSGCIKKYYTLMGEVFNETDNESNVPLKEKTTLCRSLSFDGGYGSDNGLSSNMSSIEQRSFNHQFYTLAGNVFSEPDSASQKKTELSRSSSFDSGLDSDEESCDNDLSSNISSISSVEKVAESRKVGNLLSSRIV